MLRFSIIGIAPCQLAVRGATRNSQMTKHSKVRKCKGENIQNSRQQDSSIWVGSITQYNSNHFSLLLLEFIFVHLIVTTYQLSIVNYYNYIQLNISNLDENDDCIQ